MSGRGESPQLPDCPVCISHNTRHASSTNTVPWEPGSTTASSIVWCVACWLTGVASPASSHTACLIGSLSLRLLTPSARYSLTPPYTSDIFATHKCMWYYRGLPVIVLQREGWPGRWEGGEGGGNVCCLRSQRRRGGLPRPLPAAPGSLSAPHLPVCMVCEWCGVVCVCVCMCVCVCVDLEADEVIDYSAGSAHHDIWPLGEHCPVARTRTHTHTHTHEPQQKSTVTAAEGGRGRKWVHSINKPQNAKPSVICISPLVGREAEHMWTYGGPSYCDTVPITACMTHQ